MFKEKTKVDFDSIKDKLVFVDNRTTSIEDSMKDYPGAEAICGFKERVGSTSQTITFDKVHVEVNDNHGILNANTGRFTAGTAGIYQVSVSIGYGYSYYGANLYIKLKSSSGHYQDNDEDYFLDLDPDSDTTSIDVPMSGSRYMYLERNEEIFLDYTCEITNHCYLHFVKFCVAFYSSK